MTHDMRMASEALFEVVVRSEPRLRNIKSWYFTLLATIEKWYRSEGNQGVKRAKDILLTGWLAILGEGFSCLKFVSANKDGIPTLVEPLVKAVKCQNKDLRLMSGVYSLVRVTDFWLGEMDQGTINASISTITDSTLPRTAARVMKEYSSFLDAILTAPAYSSHPLVRKIFENLRIVERLDEGEYHYLSTKAGPNGSLIENSHLDVVTLKGCETSEKLPMWKAIIRLQDEIVRSLPTDGWKSSESLGKFPVEALLEGAKGGQKVAECPGKLGLKPEKSGKVRLVAMPDYFTQYTLQPIGNWLFSILSSLDEDCTYDQRAAIPKIQKWQNEGRSVFSYDQSSCTDLFPLELQLIMLEKRFNKPLAEAVRTVLVDRDWLLTYPKTKMTRKIRWSVGQPLGVYASWPLMAVTHHLLVQFAYWRTLGDKTRFKFFKDYCICGDDIVIASVSVAQSYLKLVRDLGMKINLSKSHISGGNTGVQPISEFAKITIWNGQPLYEIKPRLMLKAVQDWRLAIPLLWDLRDQEKWNLDKRFLVTLTSRYFPRGSKYLKYLLTVPRNFGGVGMRTDVSLRAQFAKVISTGFELHPILHFLCRKIRSRLLKGKRINRRSPISEGSGIFRLDEEVFREHPANAYIRYVNLRRLKTRHLDVPIPSLSGLVKQVLSEGWDQWKHILLESDWLSSSVPWDYAAKDNDRRSDANNWRKVLKRCYKPWCPSVSADVLQLNICINRIEGVVSKARTPDELREGSIELQVQRATEILDILNRELGKDRT